MSGSMDVYELGETFATSSIDGRIRLWYVDSRGEVKEQTR